MSLDKLSCAEKLADGKADVQTHRASALDDGLDITGSRHKPNAGSVKNDAKSKQWGNNPLLRCSEGRRIESQISQLLDPSAFVQAGLSW